MVGHYAYARYIGHYGPYYAPWGWRISSITLLMYEILSRFLSISGPKTTNLKCQINQMV
jgi:hypothetical protein